SVSGYQFDSYVHHLFYKPMKLTHILYNPLTKFKKSQIAPTENDSYWRHQLVHGFVHDQGAARLGGVAGHAGLFATAEDCAALFQMLLNDGMYRGKRYFKPSTIDYFTSYQSSLSRRGLGFDKPRPRKDAGPTCDEASGLTFGHQGFTGTCIWADPETGILFVFLSNRVNPSAENSGINRLNVRTVAQSYIYKAFGYKPDDQRSRLYNF